MASRTIKPTTPPEREIPALIGRTARALPPIEGVTDIDAFGAAFDSFAGARVVLLGEATHGTSEFYRARAAITRRLIERHGFTIVAVEADWPDAARVDRWVRHRGGPRPEEDALFARFPAWMWRNVEVSEFVRWLRARNADLPRDRRAEFCGLDVYSLGASVAAVLRYLDATDPEAAAVARRRYACLTPWQVEPADYGRAVLFGAKEPCEDAAVRQLRELLERRVGNMASEEGEALFDAAQNARVALGAERYYRLMYHSGTESWNLRDRHMFETLRALLERRGPGAKAVVWAHNSHVGNAAATEMGWTGEFNIGELCRTAFGEDAALIGFGTDRGTVACASDWGGEVQIKRVLPARPDSHEARFNAAAPPCSLTDLRPSAAPELRAALSRPRLERAVGVIYRPETERQSHYFEAVLPEQFDAYVWFAETQAVMPLPGATEGGPEAEDTFPSGL